MSDKDLTAPKAVGYECRKIHDAITRGEIKASDGVRWQDTLRALSAALEAERASHTATLKDAQDECARVEALTAKLEDALFVLKDMRDDKTGLRHAVHFRRRAAVYLANLEGDKP